MPGAIDGMTNSSMIYIGIENMPKLPITLELVLSIYFISKLLILYRFLSLFLIDFMKDYVARNRSLTGCFLALPGMQHQPKPLLVCFFSK
ncbi:MAG: hypothetical protein ABSA23_02915 [Anaerolineales bacterium]